MPFSRTMIGLRLKEWVNHVYPTQFDAVVDLLVQPSSLHRYYTGQVMPGAEQLYRMSSKGLNINWLLTGDGPMCIDATEPRS